MSVVLSRHATQRITERGIDLEAIERVVQGYSARNAAKGGLVRLAACVDDRRLVLIVAEQVEGATVVTAYEERDTFNEKEITDLRRLRREGRSEAARRLTRRFVARRRYLSLS